VFVCHWVLRKILGPKRDEVTGECKLNNERLDVIRVIKSRIM
jgi:hypothetical protein